MNVAEVIFRWWFLAYCGVVAAVVIFAHTFADSKLGSKRQKYSAVLAGILALAVTVGLILRQILLGMLPLCS